MQEYLEFNVQLAHNYSTHCTTIVHSQRAIPNMHNLHCIRQHGSAVYVGMVYNKLLPVSLAFCFLRQAHRQMMTPSIMTAAITTRTATPSRLPSVKTTVMLLDDVATPAGLQA